MGKGKKTGRSCGNEDCNIVRLTIWHQLSHGQPVAMNLKTLILYGMKVQKSVNRCGRQGRDKEPVTRPNM